MRRVAAKCHGNNWWKKYVFSLWQKLVKEADD